jgi:hypothetical protein
MWTLIGAGCPDDRRSTSGYVLMLSGASMKVYLLAVYEAIHPCMLPPVPLYRKSFTYDASWPNLAFRRRLARPSLLTTARAFAGLVVLCGGGAKHTLIFVSALFILRLNSAFLSFSKSILHSMLPTCSPSRVCGHSESSSAAQE